MIPPREPCSSTSASPGGAAVEVELPEGKTEKSKKDLKPAGGMSNLQVALVNSVFGGKIKVEASTTVGDLKSAIKAKWAVRSVPEALQTFLETHTDGTDIPKPKDDRIQKFWDVLVAMD